MSVLQDRLDDVGWAPKSDMDEYTHLVFHWMREATDRIERLTKEVESLQRVVDARTAHLA